MAVFLVVSLGLLVLCLFSVGQRLVELARLKRKVFSLGLPLFKGPPLLGNSLELSKSVPGISFSVFTLQVFLGLGKAFENDDMYVFSIGPYFYVALTKANTAEILLADKQQVNKSDDYIFLHPWLGTGLITSSYGKWSKLRKKLTPAFHFRILDEFQPIINDHSEVLVENLRLEVGKPFFSLEPYVTNCALDIIASTALGVDIEAQKKTSPYVKALHEITTIMFRRVVSPWLWPSPIFWLSPSGRSQSRNLKTISSFLKKVIREKREKLTASKEEIYKFFKNSEDKKIRRAFLEILLMHNMIHEDDQFTEQDIEDEVNTFTFAGHDTTTTAMNWTFYLLGLYHEVQDKVYAEIEGIFAGDAKRPITVEDVKKMHYLERVIKESQRLYPSVPYIGRKLDKDFIINGVTVPKGVAVMIPLPVLHRDPQVFPNPEIFDPDRFLNTNRHPFSYVPFSAGPRNCIGQRFAMFEMKTVVANVIRNFRLTSLDPRDKVLLRTEIVSKADQPIRMKIEVRM